MLNGFEVTFPKRKTGNALLGCVDVSPLVSRIQKPSYAEHTCSTGSMGVADPAYLVDFTRTLDIARLIT